MIFKKSAYISLSTTEAIIIKSLGNDGLLIGYGCFAGKDSLLINRRSLCIKKFPPYSSLFVACAAGYVAFKYFQRKGTLKSFLLSGSATREAGYSSSEDHNHLLGEKGRTVAPMHPSGIVEIEGNRYDKVSEVGYMNAGKYVEVVKVEASRILIRATK